MKRLVLVFSLIMLISLSYGQSFKTGLGLRGGVTQGITIKHFVGANHAFDFLIGAHHRGLNVAVLYEIHSHSIFDVSNLSLFYGFGGHVGYYNHAYITQWGNYTGDVLAVGVSGVLGIEYTFDEIPINIGIDINPAINILPAIRYWQGGALYLRYVFR